MATTTTPRQQMIKARNLIVRRRYQEAREILLSIDHQIARRWLERLDEVAPELLPGTYEEKPRTREERDAWLRRNYANLAMDAAPRRATALLPAMGVTIMVLTLITGGLGLGAFLFLTGEVVHVALISALVTAIIGGVLMRAAVRYGKVRDGLSAIIFAALLGLLAGAAYWGILYYDYVFAETETLDRQNPALTNDEVTALLHANLREQTGQMGLAGFVLLRTQDLPVYTTAFTEDEPTLDASVGRAVLGVEFVLLLLIPPVIAYGQTRRRFCEDSNAWMQFNRAGYIAPDDTEEFMALLHVGAFQQAGYLIAASPPTRRDYYAIDSARCLERSETGTIRIRSHSGQLLKERRLSGWDYNALIHHV